MGSDRNSVPQKMLQQKKVLENMQNEYKSNMIFKSNSIPTINYVAGLWYTMI